MMPGEKAPTRRHVAGRATGLCIEMGVVCNSAEQLWAEKDELTLPVRLGVGDDLRQRDLLVHGRHVGKSSERFDVQEQAIDFAVVGKGVDDSLQRRRLQQVVVVEQGNQVTPRRSNPAVLGNGSSKPL